MMTKPGPVGEELDFVQTKGLAKLQRSVLSNIYLFLPQ